MGRLPRSALPDGCFHVVSRGVHDTVIYRDDRDRFDFLRLLERCAWEHHWMCHAYCLMTTHYHLVVDARRIELSKGMHRLNGVHARMFNRRHERLGHLFAKRFTSRCIESEEYLYEACSYVLLNPVKAWLCERVEEWPWSYSRFETVLA
ncbi:MAG: transposase [Gaiellaceae bacterium]